VHTKQSDIGSGRKAKVGGPLMPEATLLRKVFWRGSQHPPHQLEFGGALVQNPSTNWFFVQLLACRWLPRPRFLLYSNLVLLSHHMHYVNNTQFKWWNFNVCICTECNRCRIRRHYVMHVIWSLNDTESVKIKWNKKLSYRWQTARCCFVKLLRYCRTFCQKT